MAQLGVQFNPQDHSTEQSDFELLPNMIAKLEISAGDVKVDGTDIAVNFTIDVVEPEEYKGRRIWHWVDVQNRDAQRQERGQKDLAKLCRAVGHDGPLEDTEQIQFITFTAQIVQNPAGVSKKTGKAYNASNRIRKLFYPDEGNVPQPSIDANQPVAQTRPANDNRPAAANSNKPAPAAAAAGKKRPWG